MRIDTVLAAAGLRLLEPALDPDAGLREGYESAGGRFESDEAARLRLKLYRLYLYLIMWIETVPRAMGTETDWRERTILPRVAGLLDELERA